MPTPSEKQNAVLFAAAAVHARALAIALATSGAHTATKYESEKLVVRLTRTRAKRNNGRLDFVLSVSRPNFEDREFLKLCKKAGERIPVRRIQLRGTYARGKRR